MKRATLLGLALLLGTVAFLAQPVLANNHPNLARGFDAGKAYELPSDLEGVSLFNGTLNLAIPLGGRYPVSGSLSYGLTLRYHSRPWDFYSDSVNGTTNFEESSKPSHLVNAGMGWSVSLGRLLHPMDPDNDSSGWVYIGPDGSPHAFYTPPGVSTTMLPFYTRDGSFLRLSGSDSAPVVEFPDGTMHLFEPVLGDPDRRRLRQIRDQHEDSNEKPINYLDVTYRNPAGPIHAWDLADSHGRSHTLEFTTDPLVAGYYSGVEGVLIKADLAAFGGDRAEYTLEYGAEPEEINFSCPYPSKNQRVMVPFLTRVSLPEGGSYSMDLSDYNRPSNPEDNCNYFSGQLRGITLPTRGKLEYDYRKLNLPLPTGERCKDFLGPSIALQERRRLRHLGGLEGRWTYEPNTGFSAERNCSAPNNPQPPPELTNTVTDPLGHETTHYFSVSHNGDGTFLAEEYGLPLTRTIGTGHGGRFLSTETRNSSGRHLRSTYVEYESDNPNAPPGLGNQRLRINRTVFHDDNNLWTEVERDQWDGLGHYREQVSRSGDWNTNQRVSFTDFNPDHGPAFFWPEGDPWVLNTYELRTVKEGSATATESFHFDPDTGELLRRRVHTGDGAGANQGRQGSDLVQVYNYRDANDQPTGNLMSEAYHGGDGAYKVHLASGTATLTQ